MRIRFLSGDHIVYANWAGEVIRLRDEGGWWFVYGEIWICAELPFVLRYRTLIHEIVEYVLEGRLRVVHRVAHLVANICEYFCMPLIYGLGLLELILRLVAVIIRKKD